jgi:hypothetical protein
MWKLSWCLKDECLERMIFFGERSLQAATVSFLDHFHAERNHQGIGNNLITPGEEVGRTTGEIACRERLGGTMRYYYRKAACPDCRPLLGVCGSAISLCTGEMRGEISGPSVRTFSPPVSICLTQMRGRPSR